MGYGSPKPNNNNIAACLPVRRSHPGGHAVRNGELLDHPWTLGRTHVVFLGYLKCRLTHRRSTRSQGRAGLQSGNEPQSKSSAVLRVSRLTKLDTWVTRFDADNPWLVNEHSRLLSVWILRLGTYIRFKLLYAICASQICSNTTDLQIDC